MKRHWYKHTIVIVLLHIAAWTIFFLVPYFMRPNIAGIKQPGFLQFFDWEAVLQYSILVIVFYFNAYWLIPSLLNRQKYIPYTLSIMAIIICGIIYHVFIRKPIMHVRRDHIVFNGRPGERPPPPPRAMMVRVGTPFLPAILSLVMVLALSNTYRFILDKLRFDKLQRERETEHLKSELSFLRSQISPHFIFNVLNSAVALARIDPAQVEPTLIKLSGLMRYMLYDTDDTKVPLVQEIEYLEAYVELQQLRFGELVQIQYDKSGLLFGYSIEPMLLIPFVENAFKHGLVKVEQPVIVIEVKEDNAKLYFTVKNRYNPQQSAPQNRYSGIGLPNVKKRLDILYGERHKLNIGTYDDWFEAQLLIPLV